MAIEYNFTLDMDRSKRDNNIAYARTGDVDSITINADLVFNGAAYTPTGTNAFFECITPNGCSIRAAAEKTGSSVTVEVPSAAFQAAGVINVAYFRFETGDASNPTYVESTEPFAIVVREGIGDVIDTGDYIEEWRKLADQLEAIVAEVEQKAEQAEAAINEQKTEVDQLKAKVQISMAQDAEDVSDAKDTAISNINGSQGAVDAAIDKLEQKTQEAVDAAQEAIDGTLASDLQNKIDRTLKLDVADMVNISNNASLSSLTSVGSYCCKTASTAATISDSPVDDSPFNMYVFSSATSGQVMQLVVPIDLNGKPVAEWHVRFGTSSAMDPWSVIGGGADIAAGLGIDVTGDTQKTVALDTDAFYQHHEAAEVIQGSTEVTGGGRIKELTVYGATRQNLWVNPSGASNGVTVTANENGSVTLNGTAGEDGAWLETQKQYCMRPGSTYTVSVDKPFAASGNAGGFFVRYSDGTSYATVAFLDEQKTEKTFTIPPSAKHTVCGLQVISGASVSGPTVSGTYRVMLNEGSEAEPWCPPGLNGVEELSIVTAGKNLVSPKDQSVQIRGIDITCSNQEFSFNGTADGSGGRTVYFWEGAIGPGTYTLGVFGLSNSDNVSVNVTDKGTGDSIAFTIATQSTFSVFGRTEIGIGFNFKKGDSVDVDGVTVQIEHGSTKTDYEKGAYVSTAVDLDGHALNSLPDGTRDELRVDGTGAVTLVQRVGVATAPTAAGSWLWETGSSRGRFSLPATSRNKGTWNQSTELLCDKLPPATSVNDESYVVTVNDVGYAKNPAITSTATAATVAGGATYLYPLATPKEVELPDVILSDLASPSYVIYASSDVPAEIEAEVVKVDYLPAPDVYTKQEVDQKIEAASMPDIVPVSKGGTGVTTAAAERNRLGLGNTTGALPVANGGTGATSAASARTNLDVYSKAEVDGRVPKVVYGTGNIPGSAANGTIYIQYRS